MSQTYFHLRVRQPRDVYIRLDIHISCFLLSVDMEMLYFLQTQHRQNGVKLAENYPQDLLEQC